MNNYLDELIVMELRQIGSQAEELALLDKQTEKITNPIHSYCESISIAPIGESCFSLCRSQKKLTINQTFLEKVIQKSPLEQKGNAGLIFSLHEISHISQGFESFQDVKLIKLICGSSRMGYFDLQSDYLATHTLSLFRSINSKEGYRENTYLKYLYEFWCELGLSLLEVFPAKANIGKQKRTLGYAIMYHLIKRRYLGITDINLESELWPEWNDGLDSLIIFGKNGKIWSCCHPLPPNLMKNILNLISSCKYQELIETSEELTNILLKGAR